MEIEMWEGAVAAVDRSVNRMRERMGAGVVIGKGLQPELSRSFGALGLAVFLVGKLSVIRW